MGASITANMQTDPVYLRFAAQTHPSSTQHCVNRYCVGRKGQQRQPVWPHRPVNSDWQWRGVCGRVHNAVTKAMIEHTVGQTQQHTKRGRLDTPVSQHTGHAAAHTHAATHHTAHTHGTKPATSPHQTIVIFLTTSYRHCSPASRGTFSDHENVRRLLVPSS